MLETDLFNLVCSECGAVNRIPKLRRADSPVCGKCHELLLPVHPIELSDATFDKFVARSDIPILVDFWAAWCGPCRSMEPAYKEAAAMLSPDAILAKLNTEVSPLTAAKFRISSIPTLILFRGGREIARQLGAMNAPQISRWVHAH